MLVWLINASATSPHWSIGGNNTRMLGSRLHRPHHRLLTPPHAGTDKLTYTQRHWDKREVPTVVTKFQLSRPTANTLVQTTPSEHAVVCWVCYSSQRLGCGCFTLTATKLHWSTRCLVWRMMPMSRCAIFS